MVFPYNKMKPITPITMCKICGSKYNVVSHNECPFQDRPSHLKEIAERVSSTNSTTYIQEQLSTYQDYCQELSITILLIEQEMNRYKDTMQVIITSLQQIRNFLEEIQNVDKEINSR